MKREEIVSKLSQEFDVIIIGGGATGLGCAVDASSRGLKTLLLEAKDFASGTSSKSTKLIHGGLRYLKQGNIPLVRDALRERGILWKNAPHLVHPMGFLIPNYHWWEHPFYGIGVKVYDFLSGKYRLKPSFYLSKEECKNQFLTLQTQGLKGGNVYYDGQFDDARLAISLAQTALDCGALCLNYFSVTSLLHDEKKRLIGVMAQDEESLKSYTIYAKSIINATGVFSDEIRTMDDPHCEKRIAASQGIHIVVDRSFLPKEHAIIIPSTDDGRVVFFIPWHDKVIIGTTDHEVATIERDPMAMESEIVFLLDLANRYLQKEVKRSDIEAVFGGLRPLVKKGSSKNSSSLSRDHALFTSSSGLITIAGGKWTTYRKMAEDTINLAIKKASLKAGPCVTKDLKIHGYEEGLSFEDRWSVYGKDRYRIQELLKEHPEWKETIHPKIDYQRAELVFAIRSEMARTIEDILARRTRALFLHAQHAWEARFKVAEWMALELGKSKEWQEAQIASFQKQVERYSIFPLR